MLNFYERFKICSKWKKDCSSLFYYREIKKEKNDSYEQLINNFVFISFFFKFIFLGLNIKKCALSLYEPVEHLFYMTAIVTYTIGYTIGPIAINF